MNLTKESIVEWASSWVPDAPPGQRARFAAALTEELKDWRPTLGAGAEKKIEINGGDFVVPAGPLTYERVLELIGVNTERILTVVYCAKLGGDASRDGSLSPGKSVEPCDGMIFTCANTSSA